MLVQSGTLQVEEDVITAVVKHAKREARTGPEAVQAMLLDCAVQLSTKAPLYALLVGEHERACCDVGRCQVLLLVDAGGQVFIHTHVRAGLLNIDEPGLVASLVRRAAMEIGAGLQIGGNLRRARLLLRFLALLVAVNVVPAPAVVGVLQSLVDAAASVAAAGAPDGRTWQPYADQLVEMALVALPFGGVELAHAVPGQVQSLLQSVEGYMAKRPYSTDPSLRPFSAAVKEDDKLAE